jgi:hypothetical protein
VGGGVENRAFGRSQGVPGDRPKVPKTGGSGFLKKSEVLKRPVLYDTPVQNPNFSSGEAGEELGKTSKNPVFLAFAVLPPYPPWKSAPEPVLSTF